MRYAKIDEFEVVNGETNGMSLFVQGCHFRCPNCFNQEAWDFNGGHIWDKEAKSNFLNLISRPYIKRISILGGEPLADENLDDVLDLIRSIKNESDQTQYIELEEEKRHNILCKNDDKIRLSLPQKTIWLYSGYTWEQVTMKDGELVDNHNLRRFKRQCIVKQCDVFVDGRYVDSQRDITLKWRGSRNQRVIDVQKSLQSKHIVLHCD